jgi:hypothetical protein
MDSNAASSFRNDIGIPAEEIEQLFGSNIVRDLRQIQH